MKIVLIASVLLPVVAMSAVAQNRDRQKYISVTFAVDGKPTPCGNLRVQLLINDRVIVPKYSDHGFLVPAVFNRKPSEWSPNQTVNVSVSCGAYAFSFSKLHPGWVSSGLWELGIAYPPYWIERFGWTGAVERGTWLSYLASECDGCDPGIFTTVSHPTPPPSLVASLRSEQPIASGERARDIAYALAVFNVESQQNRDYLLELLNTCLSRAKDSPEDDVCDGKLLAYLTNLYWRGDENLLDPLLKVADSRRDVIDEIGTFFANLLDRRTAAAVHRMQQLPSDKQRSVCSLAGEDDFSHDPPKLERVAKRLRVLANESADRCLQEAERAEGHPAR